MIATLLGLAGGFAFNECSNFLRNRREDRRNLSKALAELLDVRHFLRLMPVVVGSLKRTLPGASAMTAQDEMKLRSVLRALLPSPESMHQRYEDAVSAVAAFLPLLAFDLRSKDMLGPMLAGLYTNIPIEPNAAPFLLKVEDEIVRAAVPKLEELIQELAKLHGRKTAKEVKKLLAKPLDPLSEFQSFLTEAFSPAAKPSDGHPAGDVS